MIIIRMNGGLGNQMFQYAFYEYIKKNNDEMYVDVEGYKTYYAHNGYELNRVFNIDVPIASVKQLKSVSINKDSLLSKVIRKIFKVELSRQSEFSEKLLNMMVVNDKISQDIYFDGYWQNSKYVSDVEEILRKKFVFRNVIGNKNIELLDMIKNSNSISIHIRRGDYLSEPGLFDVCNIEYYCNAIMEIKKQIGENLKFFVFSDDPEWCRRNMYMISNETYIDWNKKEDSWIDMYLMSQCKHNIIANSSFSWWGAWLNENKEKIVVMPKNWRNDIYYRNLNNEKWIIL